MLDWLENILLEKAPSFFVGFYDPYFDFEEYKRDRKAEIEKKKMAKDNT